MGGNQEKSSYHSSRTTSPSSSSNSRSSSNVSYRDGTAKNHSVTAKRKDKVVVINHHQANPAKDEPRASDYYHGR
ncbi:unnamed protein product [Sordaria macrospora k-hell]|uniref:WGS project CABT00000000 data, contig 2.1 n=1 Tax=Sordaria macrospora (strain ATCC MYA-333 / DSM 997 / K(L3346) / K-hell) TaxID=771870 RepID=F7VM77_SORMK|nr:uncharacterized protein SMAC_12717 [Sordaria macrospora k-hell]CCC06605.1 unnamed protein product [Sordaria macrospora k-hell]